MHTIEPTSKNRKPYKITYFKRYRCTKKAENSDPIYDFVLLEVALFTALFQVISKEKQCRKDFTRSLRDFFM